MCVASRYLDQIEVMLEQIKGDMEVLVRKQSEYDKKLSEAYHEIEVRKFNACEGYYLTKNLQEILQKRRIVKSELYRMNEVHKQLFRSMKDRFPTAKKKVEKSKSSGAKWFENFSFSYSDIENELTH